MIRRTRKEIETYYGEDMESQGLKFPEVQDPQPLFYKFSKLENQIFDETMQLLVSEFTYARYKPLTYYEGKSGSSGCAEPAEPCQVHEDPDGQTFGEQFSCFPPDPRTLHAIV